MHATEAHLLYANARFCNIPVKCGPGVRRRIPVYLYSISWLELGHVDGCFRYLSYCLVFTALASLMRQC